MISELTMYTVVCDRCKKQADAGNGTVSYPNVNYAVGRATGIGWKLAYGGHYCPDCWEGRDGKSKTAKPPIESTP